MDKILHKSKGGEGISDSQLVRLGYNQVYKTGLFDTACAKWRRQPFIEKIWSKFQIFFTIKVTNYLKNNTADDEAQYTTAQVQELLDHNLAAFAAATTDNKSTRYTGQKQH